MTQVETAPKKEQYNQTAVRTSEALEQAREAIRSEFAGVERTRCRAPRGASRALSHN